MNNFFIRILSGILLILTVLFVSIKGGLVLLLASIYLSVFASYEFHKAMVKLGYDYPLALQIGLGTIYAYCIYAGKTSLASGILALNIILSLILSALGNKYRLEDMIAYVFAFMYCNFMFSFLLMLDKPIYIFLLALASWGTDTFAYVFGMLFGSNKLIENLSPNKTIEGALGGSIMSTIIISLVAYKLNLGRSYLAIGFIALALSILAQLGDLCASYIKRLAKIKDYGFIIPGHGGILDRFDSVVFILPIAYLLFEFIK